MLVFDDLIIPYNWIVDIIWNCSDFVRCVWRGRKRYRLAFSGISIWLRAFNFKRKLGQFCLIILDLLACEIVSAVEIFRD